MDGMVSTWIAMILVGVSVTTMIWRRTSTFMAEARKEMREAMDAAAKAEFGQANERLDRLHPRIQVIEGKIIKLEDKDHQLEVNVLKAVKEAADQSVAWREELRKEFIPREIVESKINNAVSDHARECRTWKVPTKKQSNHDDPT